MKKAFYTISDIFFSGARFVAAVMYEAYSVVFGQFLTRSILWQ